MTSPEPTWATAIAAALPKRPSRILAIGSDKHPVTAWLCHALQDAEVHAVASAEDAGEYKADAVVLCVALAPTPQAECVLRAAAECLAGGGVVTAFFASGCDGFSRTGLEVVLSRADLVADAVMETRCPETEAVGWCVGARLRQPGPGEFGLQRRANRQAAEACNREGERLWQQGEARVAAAKFAEAIRLWNREARYFNNLGAALFSLNHFEEAYARFQDALHLRPSYREAWDNLDLVAQVVGRRDEAEALRRRYAPERQATNTGD